MSLCGAGAGVAPPPDALFRNTAVSSSACRGVGEEGGGRGRGTGREGGGQRRERGTATEEDGGRRTGQEGRGRREGGTDGSAYFANIESLKNLMTVVDFFVSCDQGSSTSSRLGPGFVAKCPLSSCNLLMSRVPIPINQLFRNIRYFALNDFNEYRSTILVRLNLTRRSLMYLSDRIIDTSVTIIIR